jgi:hypothetical protein
LKKKKKKKEKRRRKRRKEYHYSKTEESTPHLYKPASFYSIFGPGLTTGLFFQVPPPKSFFCLSSLPS